MKTVFILGAGASREGGAPLMQEFLDRAQDLLRMNNEDIAASRAAFDDVFAALADLQGVHHKAELDLDNIEAVFGAVEMAATLGKLGDRDAEGIRRLRRSLITVICKTLDNTIGFPLHRSEEVLPPYPYGQFANQIHGANRMDPFDEEHRVSIITFNYDICVEFALGRVGLEYDYGLGNADPAGIPLLKLHGSVNWAESPNHGIVAVPVPVSLNAVRRYSLQSDDYFYFRNGSLLAEKARAPGFEGLGDEPIIVPPTWNKNAYRGQLANVWAAAARELSSAENIIVIGYSLPETDSFFRYLFALGSQSDTRVRNFIVIDPSEASKPRFQSLVGGGTRARFRFLPQTFGRSIRTITKVLENPSGWWQS